uniref:Uncharacterized protein MANES_17G081000 n=1 Tax=Rhizophora mucronata TaxID=61149 RepID=A0A2P2QE91_RHIMU
MLLIVHCCACVLGLKEKKIWWSSTLQASKLRRSPIRSPELLAFARR